METCLVGCWVKLIGPIANSLKSNSDDGVKGCIKCVFMGGKEGVELSFLVAINQPEVFHNGNIATVVNHVIFIAISPKLVELNIVSL